uniref:Interleukin-1 n=1 Tax=Vombatus ursinus TaxID=29139 RepID=A0A4X2KQG5_VOMUR
MDFFSLYFFHSVWSLILVFPAILTSTPCRDMSLENGKGSPIYLGIVDPKLCLCCEESGGQPTLELKEKDIMELHHALKAEESFVFHVNTNGSISTFQSAAFPGWFISSSAEQGKPIKMTKDVGKDNTAFHFDPKV